MKKFTILLIFNLLLMQAFSQTIPNAGFENWTNFGSFSDPNDWSTLNSSLSILGIYNTQPSTDSHSGTTAALLETQDLFGTALPGVLTLAQLEVDFATQSSNMEGGIACTTHPTALKGFFKYNPAGDDTCVFFLYITRYNFENAEADTIADGFIMIDSTVTDWTEFSIPFEYYLTDVPDTFAVTFISSISENSTVGTQLLIDDLSLDFSDSHNVFLGNDTILTQNETLILDAGPGPYTYEWHMNGDPLVIGTSQTYVVESEGTYSVIVRTEFGLPAMDTIQIQYINGIKPLMNENNWQLVQMPGESKIELSWNNEGPEYYTVNNVFGQTIQHGNCKNWSNPQSLVIEASTPGIYYLRMTGTNLQNFTKAIVIR